MRRGRAVFQVGNWRIVVADAVACLMFFVLSLMLLNQAASSASNDSCSISTAVKSLLAMFVE